MRPVVGVGVVVEEDVRVSELVVACVERCVSQVAVGVNTDVR